jgi:hypothetical protein
MYHVKGKLVHLLNGDHATVQNNDVLKSAMREKIVCLTTEYGEVWCRWASIPRIYIEVAP